MSPVAFDFATFNGLAPKLGDAVIFASRSKKIFRLNRATGKVVWYYRTPGEVESSPVIAGNTIFAGCMDGKLYAFSLANGKKLWQYDAGAGIKASPAIGQGRLVIGSTDGAIYCFGK